MLEELLCLSPWALDHASAQVPTCKDMQDFAGSSFPGMKQKGSYQNVPENYKNWVPNKFHPRLPKTLDFVAFLSQVSVGFVTARDTLSYPSLGEKSTAETVQKRMWPCSCKHFLWLVQSFCWVVSAPSCSSHSVPPKSNRCARLKKGQTLPIETICICVLLAASSLGFRRIRVSEGHPNVPTSTASTLVNLDIACLS